MKGTLTRKQKIRPVYVWFLGTLLVAAFILNLVCMIYYSYNARKMDEDDRTRILSQTVSFVDRYMKEVEEGASMLAVSSDVQKLMTYRIGKNYWDYVSCMNMLTEYAMTVPKIYRIDLYERDKRTLLTSSEGVFYDLSEEESAYYQACLEREESWFWDPDYAGKEPKLVSQTRNGRYMSLIKPVYSMYTGKKMGVLCLSIALSELENLMPQTEDGAEALCLTYEGRPILGEVLETGKVRRISMASAYSSMEFDYYFVPRSVRIFNLQYIAIILLVLAFFAAIFFSIVHISERKMFEPVDMLLDGFQKVEQGKFGVRLEGGQQELFQELFHGFNHMASTLERMINELSDERTRRNEFKFQLLQMQIKPHFLYNLFNNMIWMMEQKDYERLGVLIQSTAGYYKTALNYGNSDIMLMDNERQLEYFAEIQKIRFGDRFTFSVCIPEEMKLYAIPNLLLQPLVENAIVHGLTGMEEVCHIQVTAEEEGSSLVLSVEDDGCGIRPEELENIHQELANYEKDGSRYFALVNIRARLQNRYKGKADFTIVSRLRQGTRAVIKIPLEEVR